MLALSLLGLAIAVWWLAVEAYSAPGCERCARRDADEEA